VDYPAEYWDEVIAVNLTAVFRLSQFAAQQMIRQEKKGKIVNIASVLSFQGEILVPAYAYEEYEHVAHDASELQDHFEVLVPYGYENDAGGFGDVVLDVRKRTITVERNDRFEDYSTTTYEV
jgi:hypothetical protein